MHSLRYLVAGRSIPSFDDVFEAVARAVAAVAAGAAAVAGAAAGGGAVAEGVVGVARSFCV